MVDSIAKEPSALRAGEEARALDRGNALSMLEEARRLRDLAELVHDHRIGGSVDSAPLAHRSLALALRVLVTLHGDTPPSEFGQLVDKAKAISDTASLTATDFSEDAMLVFEMKERFADPSLAATSAEARRYDRAFVRCEALYEAVQGYASERLGVQARGPLVRLRAFAAVGIATAAIGFLLGTRFRAGPPPVVLQPGAAFPSQAAPPSAGFKATFYRDQDLKSAVFTRIDRSIAFDWGPAIPEGLEQGDHFSARWTGNLQVVKAGKHQFFLTSDDGSRLFIDDKLVIDNWGGHAEVSMGSVVELASGIHPIRVEYFDGIGNALVKLEWQPEGGTRRLLDAQDLK